MSEPSEGAKRAAEEIDEQSDDCIVVERDFDDHGEIIHAYLVRDKAAEIIQSAIDESNAPLRARIEELTKDAADDDTHVRALALTVLNDQAVNGDSYGVPSIPTVVEALVAVVKSERARIEALEAEREQVRKLLFAAYPYIAVCEQSQRTMMEIRQYTNAKERGKA